MDSKHKGNNSPTRRTFRSARLSNQSHGAAKSGRDCLINENSEIDVHQERDEGDEENVRAMPSILFEDMDAIACKEPLESEDFQLSQLNLNNFSPLVRQGVLSQIIEGEPTILNSLCE